MLTYVHSNIIISGYCSELKLITDFAIEILLAISADNHNSFYNCKSKLAL